MKKTERQVLKEHGVKLLEGRATVVGQISARKKALTACLQSSDPIPKRMMKAWIDSHVNTLRKLYYIKRNKRQLLNPKKV